MEKNQNHFNFFNHDGTTNIYRIQDTCIRTFSPQFCFTAVMNSSSSSSYSYICCLPQYKIQSHDIFIKYRRIDNPLLIKVKQSGYSHQTCPIALFCLRPMQNSSFSSCSLLVPTSMVIGKHWQQEKSSNVFHDYHSNNHQVRVLARRTAEGRTPPSAV